MVMKYCGRYCTEGKRTFGSRFLLDKHIRLKHRSTEGQVSGYSLASRSCSQVGTGLGTSLLFLLHVWPKNKTNNNNN